MFPVETDFTPIRRYEGFEQNHAVVARGQASESPHDRNGGRYRERREQAPQDEASLSAQALEAQLAAQNAPSNPPGPLSALGAWLVQRLENMSSES